MGWNGMGWGCVVVCGGYRVEWRKLEMDCVEVDGE